MIAILLAAAVPSALPAPSQADVQRLLSGADHAVQVGRLDQAALMLDRAAAAGATGILVDRIRGDLAYALGKYDQALAFYGTVFRYAPKGEALRERLGLAALQAGDVKRASAMLSEATSTHLASWRAWNAMGVIADERSDWVSADADYAEASRLAPHEFAPLNNRGWSLLLRGNWQAALGLFEQAVAIDPRCKRAQNNLELAQATLAAQLPERQRGETDRSWAARLNDAGVAAALKGDKRRAAAAFAQALNVSGKWYARAADNLQVLRTP